MKLADLNPHWISAAGRHGMGVAFDCPNDGLEHGGMAAWFENPIDGGPPRQDRTVLWHREGDTFETLTVSPSIAVVPHEQYPRCHIFITKGEIIMC